MFDAQELHTRIQQLKSLDYLLTLHQSADFPNFTNYLRGREQERAEKEIVRAQ